LLPISLVCAADAQPFYKARQQFLYTRMLTTPAFASKGSGMPNVSTASAFSVAQTADAVVEDIAMSLSRLTDLRPDLLTLFATESLAEAEIASKLAARFADVPIFGGTSCKGVITDAGVHIGDPHAAGVLAIYDRDGAYAVGSAQIGDDPRSAARRALEIALKKAGRHFETPAQIWTCQPPGAEEKILSGFADVVGLSCPILGGSSADERIAGGWRQFSNEGVLQDTVVVAVLFPSAPTGMAFKSGYAPTEHYGVVSRSDGRRLIEIDGRPAAQVYAEWTDNVIDPACAGTILQQSTPFPLARRVGAFAGVDEFLLSHPATVERDASISLFTDVAEGEVLRLMTGNRESLVERAGQVIKDACMALPDPGAKAAGGLVIYCGGCMLAVSDELHMVAASMKAAFRDAPFLAPFTFGEQGALVSLGNRHGNLMIAATVLSHV
jgi:hypothetical protein